MTRTSATGAARRIACHIRVIRTSCRSCTVLRGGKAPAILLRAAPVFTARLKSLIHVLKAGEADAKAKGLAEAEVLGTRLAPDMFDLKRQVQIATDHAKGAMARLAGIEIPSFADTEETFADLYARIDKTLAFVASVKPEAVNGREATASSPLVR